MTSNAARYRKWAKEKLDINFEPDATDEHLANKLHIEVDYLLRSHINDISDREELCDVHQNVVRNHINRQDWKAAFIYSIKTFEDALYQWQLDNKRVVRSELHENMDLQEAEKRSTTKEPHEKRPVGRPVTVASQIWKDWKTEKALMWAEFNLAIAGMEKSPERKMMWAQFNHAIALMEKEVRERMKSEGGAK